MEIFFLYIYIPLTIIVTSIPSFAHPRQKLQAKAMVKNKKCIAKILFTQTNSHEKV